MGFISKPGHKYKSTPEVNGTTRNGDKKTDTQYGQGIRQTHPFVFSKCNIKDGFWRMVASALDAWNFVYALPRVDSQQSIDETILVVPHALQMGWAESPPFFCAAATETARDVIEQFYKQYHNIPAHPLEKHLLDNETEQRTEIFPQHPTTCIEVYVDDFIVATNNTLANHLQHLARAILHGIHSVFPPPSVTGHTVEDPIAMKKLLQLEGLFQHKKEILGWEFDGKNYTIALPTKKCQRINDLINETIKHKTANKKQLQKVQGKLIHAAMGMPGGKGLLSPIYRAVAKCNTTAPITGELRQCLKDWKIIIKEIAKRPTSVLELVAGDPQLIGYVDASKQAAGGVWISGTTQVAPFIVWRLQWPQDIQKLLTSSTNKGTLSINDLEMAGTLLAWLVLEQITPIPLQHTHVGIFCDNDSTVSWHQKKSTSTSTIAGHLLRALALRLHIQLAAPLQTVHLAGADNKMADVASRSFNDPLFTKSNTTFINTFSQLFPLQSNSWREYQIPNKLASKVISCLRGRPLTMASWTTIIGQERNSGTTGKNTPKLSKSTHTCNHVTTPKKSSSSQLSLLGSGQVTMAKEVLSEFHLSQKLSQPSQRPWNWLENHPLSTRQKKRTKLQWHGSLRDTEEKTLQLHHNLHSQSESRKNVKMLDQDPKTPSK